MSDFKRTYTVWLVDYSNRELGDKSKRYYTDFPIIFNGNLDEYNVFMNTEYPNHVSMRGLFGNKEETEQFKKFNELRDCDNFPTIPYLQVHLSNKGTSGYLETYLINKLK